MGECKAKEAKGWFGRKSPRTLRELFTLNFIQEGKWKWTS